MEVEKELLDAIKRRRNMERKHISITKALKLNNMEEYRGVCVNRLKEHIDGEHIIGDFFHDFDILLDDVGMEKTEEILKGYIPQKWLSDCMEYIKSINSAVDSQNNVLYILRRMKKEDIRKSIKDISKYLEEEVAQERMKKYLKAELKARNLINRFSSGLKFSFVKWKFFLVHTKTYFAIFRSVKALKKRLTGGL